MFTSFRRIRQRLLGQASSDPVRKSLLDSSQARRYLVYAIGEIALVVIGILIALQINNWNSERILQNTKHSLLQDLIQDLKADTLAFKNQIKSYQRLIDLKKHELLKTSYEDTPLERLIELITPVFYPHRITDLTFQKIGNSGITKLSKDGDLSDRINRYYITSLGWHDEIMDWEERQTYQEGNYWMYEQDVFELSQSDLPRIQNPEQGRIALIRLITSPRGRNHLAEDLDRKIRILEHLQDMYHTATELIQEIQNDLEISNGN